MNRRIIHVPRRFTADEWGGTETVLTELIAQQRNQGWQPEIHTSLALSRTRAETWRQIPIRRYSYCYPFFGLTRMEKERLDKKGGNLLSLPLFLSLACARGVRIFPAHSLKRLGGQVFTAARLQRKPFVVTLHGGVFDVPESEIQEMTDAQEGKLEWGRIFGALFRSRQILEKADAVICIGRSEFDNARRMLGHDRMHHLGNGVDAARFAAGNGAAFRQKHDIPATAKVVACYSRFDPQKDQLSLIEAFDALAPGSPDLHLVLAGPCTVADYLARLDRRIVASPFAARIRRLAAIDSAGSALPDAYAAADIFALPSRHEPFGIVVLEAWSAGKPVVASCVGGLRNLITEGETGLFAIAGQSADLAARIGDLIQSPALCARLGEAGKTLARERYSWPKVAADTEDIYRVAEAHCHPGRNRR
jgi:glycosyltransferase involved in cell wall biosynthesis